MILPNQVKQPLSVCIPVLLFVHICVHVFMCLDCFLCFPVVFSCMLFGVQGCRGTPDITQATVTYFHSISPTKKRFTHSNAKKKIQLILALAILMLAVRAVEEGPFVCLAWAARVCLKAAVLSSLCGLAALMHYLSYLEPGKVNEVLALFEEVKMGLTGEDQRKLGDETGDSERL